METCFADTPRIKDKPFEKRIGGDGLLVRDKYGNVEMRFGWFSESQVRQRKAWGKRVEREVRENSFFAKALGKPWVEEDKL